MSINTLHKGDDDDDDDNNNNNNNNGRLLKIPTGTRKNFFEMYRQSGHALSKTFASPDFEGPVSVPSINGSDVLCKTLKSEQIVTNTQEPCE